ncbi:MAG: alpha-glucosidase [Gammaproteobacteria bacterium]
MPQHAAARELPWWRGAVIYHIYPRSFRDANDDGIGDLAGITNGLGYVASLGVDAVWLSPFFTSPMKDFGYDVADYCDVDPIFGTLQDFDRLLEAAHGHGLKVIIDQVYSHTSDQHPWFRESCRDRDNARAEWYVWADPKIDGSPPTNWQSVFGGCAWTWNARRGQYFLHNFLAEQPDLNVHNPEVQDALLEAARFWFDKGVDGFRLDAINYAMHDVLLRDNPPAPSTGRPRLRPADFQRPLYNKSHVNLPQFIERIRKVADDYGGRFLVAEIGGEESEAEMKLLTAGDARFHTAYGFNFLYADRLTPDLIRSALDAWPQAPGSGWPSWAFSNHDAPRAISRWSIPEHRVACAKVSMLLLLCLRGNIFLYQGEELGLPQAQIGFEDLRDPEAISNWPSTLGRDGARTPMPWKSATANAGFSTATPWLPVSPEHFALAVDRQQQEPGSQLALARRLIGFRHGSAVLREGSLHFIPAQPDLLVFERRLGGQHLLCAFNLGLIACDWRPDNHRSCQIIESVGGVEEWRFPPLSGLIVRCLP